jgi:hypothetical protein
MSTTKHKIDEKWLRLHISRKDYSLRGFAAALGMDPSALHALLKGKRKVQLEEVEAIARLLEQPLAEVLAKVGGLKLGPVPGVPGAAVEARPAAAAAPVGGSVDALTGEVKFAPTVESKDADVVALAMTGDPFLESWRVLCAPGEVSATLGAGMDTAIVRTADGRTLLRKIRPAFAPGRYDLGPVFGFGAREDGVEVVGIIPVLGMGR